MHWAMQCIPRFTLSALTLFGNLLMTATTTKQTDYNEILNFWFGDTSNATLPSQERTGLWFNPTAADDAAMKKNFAADFKNAAAGKYDAWKNEARGRLALILLLDQFPRYLFRGTKKVFTHDEEAIQITIEGAKLEQDHELTLMERAFFYMPLLHSEDIHMQGRAVLAYEALANLSLPEVSVIFKELLGFAILHYETIKKFGRFPQRNKLLKRESTPEELEFLQ